MSVLTVRALASHPTSAPSCARQASDVGAHPWFAFSRCRRRAQDGVDVVGDGITHPGRRARSWQSDATATHWHQVLRRTPGERLGCHDPVCVCLSLIVASPHRSHAGPAQEFRQRMPRSEVEQIETIVRREALAVRPGVFVVTTGSYRRGKVTLPSKSSRNRARLGPSHPSSSASPRLRVTSFSSHLSGNVRRH